MTYIPETLRREVRTRAKGKGFCEYCLLGERYASKPHETDHVIAEKHGGLTDSDNLCLSCFDCNRYKGSDLCSLDAITGTVVALFHPRHDSWTTHFQIEGAMLTPLTATGRVTVKLLNLNDQERVDEREDLRLLGFYPGRP